VLEDSNKIFVLEVGSKKKALFIKFLSIYPECEHLIFDQPQLFPLICLKTNCPRNMNCMYKLAKRTKYIFDSFPDADLLILYFRYRDQPKKHRAGVFWKDMSEPRFITFNEYSWEKVKSLGTIYEWKLPDFITLDRG
jgi:hypothetical protein